MRYPSIDILRTLAIFLMVMVHFVENLSGTTLPMTGLGAPLFAFLSGVSYHLWASTQEARGKSEETITKVSIRRGLFVFGVGFAFNILVWLPEDTFNWDVLTFIGAALLLLNFARHIPLPILSLMAVIAILVGPILRQMADYQSYWTLGYFDPDWTLSDLMVGFLACGYFPIFPWIAFSLTGFVTSSLMFNGPVELQPSTRPMMLLGTGLLLLSAIALFIQANLTDKLTSLMLGGWHMFPPTVEYVLATLGMSLLLLGILHQWVDRNPNHVRYQGLLDIFKTYSRYSLTIYVLHQVVHLWPLWIYGASQGLEPTYYWQKAFPVAVSLGLSWVFLVILYFVLRWLGPDKRHGIETAMRWLCD